MIWEFIYFFSESIQCKIKKKKLLFYVQHQSQVHWINIRTSSLTWTLRHTLTAAKKISCSLFFSSSFVLNRYEPKKRRRQRLYADATVRDFNAICLQKSWPRSSLISYFLLFTDTPLAGSDKQAPNSLSQACNKNTVFVFVIIVLRASLTMIVSL